MSEAENKKVWTVIQKMIPFDLLVVGKHDEPDGWYRIPSWRVEFEGEALQGFDIRIHKAMSPTGWTISEGSTGHKIYQGWGDDEFETETSGDVLDEFVAIMLPKLDRAKMEAGIAKAREHLAKLPPCPFTARPEGGTLLDAAKELVAAFADADYTVTRRQNNAIGKLAGLVNPVPQAGSTNTAPEPNVRDNSDSGTPAATGHTMNVGGK